MNTPARFTPPLQARSAQTLARMVDAARNGLESKRFNELTLAELTRQAGVTVGAFYQRFPSKEALLEYMEEQAYQEIRESGTALLADPPTQPAPSTRQLIRSCVSGMAQLYEKHRGILRELVQRSRSSEERQERRMDMTRDVGGAALEWILRQGDPIDHPEPRRALGVALLFTSSALRDVILFRESWAGCADVGTLVEELVRAAEAYLGLSQR